MKSMLTGLCLVGLGALSLPAAEPPLWINVTPLLDERLAVATAEDLAFLAGNTIIDGAAYSCTLVPEGNPAVDKAAIYARRYRETAPLVKAKCGIRQGVLLQATMGHGWTPNEVTPWQKVVKEDGDSMYKFCPLDTRFLDHMSAQAKTLADLAPDFFMVDDDTRLITGVRGCYCPLHLAEFAKRTGRKWTREELRAALRDDAKLAEAWDRLLSDSIAGLMERIRAAFPSPIPGVFCCCALDAHHAARMARILAAPGQSPVVRINGAPYCQDRLYDGLSRSSMLAREMADVGPGVTILSESDTCPQNRYATSATRLLDYMETMTFDGCDGALIGVTAKEWEGLTISAEDFGDECLQGTVNGAADLTRHDPAAIESSRFLHANSGLVEAKEFLAPGSLRFVNGLGGRIAVLAPDVPRHWDLSHFVYFTETRKRQMAKTLRWLGGGRIPGGAYYVGDAPVWCKAGTAKTGELVLYFDNLDLDAVEPLGVRFEVAPKTIERLCDDGVWRPVRFTARGDGVCEISVRLETMRPVILRANREGTNG